MSDKKLDVSTVGKLIAAVVVGLVGGGITGKTIGKSETNYYELPERSVKTLDRISERQIEFGNRIAKLEASTEYVLNEVKRNSAGIKENAKRNEKIIEDLRMIERKLPYNVSFK